MSTVLLGSSQMGLRTGPTVVLECSRGAHLNRHIWLVAQEYHGTSPKWGKTTLKRYLHFRGLSLAECLQTAPSVIWMAGGVLCKHSCPRKQLTVVWTVTSRSEASRGHCSPPNHSFPATAGESCATHLIRA